MTQTETSVNDKRVTALVNLEYGLHDTCWVDAKDEPCFYGTDLLAANGTLPTGEVAAELVWARNLIVYKRRLGSLKGVAIFTDGSWATFEMRDVAEPGDEKIEFNWVHIEP